ncbi:hypothetical protein QBC43DRAFT_287939 [Cladorrhinum sp. PSN259]|nr:hypothetical protein QBC43DRAFT_287939 [Cladorrhinum sp. PSN259]
MSDDEEGMSLVDLGQKEEATPKQVLPPLRQKPLPKVWGRPFRGSGIDESGIATPTGLSKPIKHNAPPPRRMRKTNITSCAATGRAGDVAVAVPRLKPGPGAAKKIEVIELSPSPEPAPRPFVVPPRPNLGAAVTAEKPEVFELSPSPAPEDPHLAGPFARPTATPAIGFLRTAPQVTPSPAIGAAPDLAPRIEPNPSHISHPNTSSLASNLGVAIMPDCHPGGAAGFNHISSQAQAPVPNPVSTSCVAGIKAPMQTSAEASAAGQEQNNISFLAQASMFSPSSRHYVGTASDLVPGTTAAPIAGLADTPVPVGAEVPISGTIEAPQPGPAPKTKRARNRAAPAPAVVSHYNLRSRRGRSQMGGNQN